MTEITVAVSLTTDQIRDALGGNSWDAFLKRRALDEQDIIRALCDALDSRGEVADEPASVGWTRFGDGPPVCGESVIVELDPSCRYKGVAYDCSRREWVGPRGVISIGAAPEHRWRYEYES